MPRAALRRYFRHGLLTQLIVFEAVVRLGSVTKAAESLHLAQPTVSLQLRKLSETLELQLFEQRGRQLHLTRGGRELLSACEELIELLLRTEARLAPLRGGEGDIVRIGAVSGARQLAARMLASFCARHPGIQASLHIGNRSQLMERLAAEEDHLYILTLPDDASGVKAHLLATESLRFYCSASSPLAAASKVSLSELANETFVVREPGSGTRSMLQAVLAAGGHEMHVRAEFGNDEAVAEAIAAGIGVGLLSVTCGAPFVASGLLAEVRTELANLVRSWHLVHAERAALPAGAQLFLREALAERESQAVFERAPIAAGARGAAKPR
jgi:LysR family transcriptional regulator, low CO2-responsive transcriptional regulator